jgi:hypothetical protein
VNKADKMSKATLYFSYYQSRDGLISNLKRRLGLKNIINKALETSEIEGATITRNTGYWNGSSEPSLEALIYDVPADKIDKLAGVLKARLNQDSILVDYNNESKFI